jgi:hypothetical protein
MSRSVAQIIVILTPDMGLSPTGITFFMAFMSVV